MSDIVRIGDATLYLGDVLAVLAGLPDESVHCVVTSPPYWGLRDYGTGTWEGGSAECDHRHALGGEGPSSAKQNTSHGTQSIAYTGTCGKCGARRIDQQIGLEDTPEEYVAKMVAVFREVRRVLRKDGTCWVNLGDSYASTPAGNTSWNHGAIFDGRDMSGHHTARRSSTVVGDLKPKDLVGIPWRVAFALQADGWYLRSDIIWSKPNPMPESVTDRPTKAHEYLFLLTKSARYFYDAEAIKETAIFEGVTKKATGSKAKNGQGEHRETAAGFTDHDVTISGRNRRTVWTIATEPFPGAHFATFPRKLVEPCILAGCPRKVCPECGAPWVREVERGENTGVDGKENNRAVTLRVDAVRASGRIGETPRRTIGEHPTCDHGLPPVPGTVLEPFLGSGTTLVVALSHGRRGVGIELKPDYFDMACNRLRHGTVDPEEVAQAERQTTLDFS